MQLDGLQKQIRGKVTSKASANFDAVCDGMVWNNIKPDRSPDLIVTVKNDDDVVAAINFARENGLKVSMHGGGHTWCGLAVRHGGMIIDLSDLNEVQINPEAQKAIIQPVISNRELAQRLGEQGLAFPIGHCPTVKAGGYLLNGGMSWNMGHWGPACLSVEAIECITADGQKIKASSEHHPDLFWAARGCGPGMFAVVTRFHLKCYSLPKGLLSSNYYFSLDDLQKVSEEIIALGWQMPDFVELSIFLIKAPPELANRCQINNGKLCMITAVAFGATYGEGIAALSILEKANCLNKCLAKTINEPTSFQRLADLSGAVWPEQHRNLCENQCSQANPVEILMAFRDKIVEAPSPKSVIVFCQSTGQHALLQSRVDIALSMEGYSYGGIWSIWENKDEDADNYAWHRGCTDILKKYTSQHYIGETDIVEDPSRVRNSFSPEKWARLEQIRAQYDPQNLFFGYLGGIEKTSK